MLANMTLSDILQDVKEDAMTNDTEGEFNNLVSIKMFTATARASNRLSRRFRVTSRINFAHTD